MKAEIITIGDEILIGQTVDTNSAWIAQELNLLGIDVVRIVSISDKKDEIFKALNNARKNTDLVLITGGLGPTDDDITKKTLAEYFDTKLVQNKEVLNHVEEFVIKRKAHMNDRNVKQADVPENCSIIKNEIGTAPGMLFNKGDVTYISMPGVPFEMKRMMTQFILPELAKIEKGYYIIHKVILTQGWPESKLAEHLEEWENQIPEEISVAYLPSPGIIKLRLTAKGTNQEHLINLISDQVKKLKILIPRLICGYDNDKLEDIVGMLLNKEKKTLSLAESCTGGNISHLITSIPGSSEYFLGGVVAYSNQIKEAVLFVNNNSIVNYGAVSKQVVEEMAMGVRRLYKSDFSIATSGIAGPGGGTEEKPVGTTWIAVASETMVLSKKYVLGNHRGRNIQMASIIALNMLRKLILGIEL